MQKCRYYKRHYNFSDQSVLGDNDYGTFFLLTEQPWVLLIAKKRIVFNISMIEKAELITLSFLLYTSYKCFSTWFLSWQGTYNRKGYKSLSIITIQNCTLQSQNILVLIMLNHGWVSNKIPKIHSSMLQIE